MPRLIVRFFRIGMLFRRPLTQSYWIISSKKPMVHQNHRLLRSGYRLEAAALFVAAIRTTVVVGPQLHLRVAVWANTLIVVGHGGEARAGLVGGCWRGWALAVGRSV